MKFNTLYDKINEKKSDYEIYHASYTQCIEEARKYVEKNGYTVDDDDMFSIVGMGPKKPSAGKTNKLHIPLYKNGKPQKKELHVQVYGMDKGNYELNMYIS